MPCPISARGTATITELSRAILTQPLSPASPDLMLNKRRPPSRSRSCANHQPTPTKPAPTMPPMIALRRVNFTTSDSLGAAQDRRRAMEGAADRAVGAAAADIGKGLVDLPIGGFGSLSK